MDYRRCAYTDREDNNRYLCDEILGLDKGQRVSMYILLRALVCAGTMSYVKVKELIENWTGLRRSSETYRRWVLHIGKFIEEQRKKKCAQIFETPTSHSDEFGKDPDFLFLEADGCHIYMRVPPPPQKEIQKGSIQKASSKKEVRLGLWYEGKRPRRGTEGNGEFEVTGKTYFGGKMSVEEFWETAAMTGVERYGLGPLTQVFGGGDGANWIAHLSKTFRTVYLCYAVTIGNVIYSGSSLKKKERSSFRMWNPMTKVVSALVSLKNMLHALKKAQRKRW